jgi:hypothetical protein
MMKDMSKSTQKNKILTFLTSLPRSAYKLESFDMVHIGIYGDLLYSNMFDLAIVHLGLEYRGDFFPRHFGPFRGKKSAPKIYFFHILRFSAQFEAKTVENQL